MVNKIISNFKIYGDFVEAKPFGSGHINETFLVAFNQAGIKVNYILRKINSVVFKEPLIVVENTLRVTNYIKEKLLLEGNNNISNYVMQLVEAKNSKYYHIDENGGYWCAVLFLSNSYTVNYVKDYEQAYQAAKAFGRFQKYLVDEDVSKYKYSIPNFHNLKNRLDNFDDAVKDNSVGRLKNIDEEMLLVQKYRYLSERITKLTKNNELPIRITHNDTKVNNVMLNKETNIGECVIDLDTVMPGTVLYDFGDMVRTSTSPVEEDEKDISKVTMRINVFEGLVKGYLGELSEVLEDIEIDNLIYGAQVIVYEQAIRFLTDYLRNDVYYHTAYPEHNLVRAKTQFALLNSIDEQLTEMNKIVALNKK